MTEFLKDKFSSRPTNDHYRDGWDKTFGITETVTAISGGGFRVNVTLKSPNGTTRQLQEDTRTHRGAEVARLRTGQTWRDTEPILEICHECGEQRRHGSNCPECGDKQQ